MLSDLWRLRVPAAPRERPARWRGRCPRSRRGRGPRRPARRRRRRGRAPPLAAPRSMFFFGSHVNRGCRLLMRMRVHCGNVEQCSACAACYSEKLFVCKRFEKSKHLNDVDMKLQNAERIEIYSRMSAPMQPQTGIRRYKKQCLLQCPDGVTRLRVSRSSVSRFPRANTTHFAA